MIPQRQAINYNTIPYQDLPVKGWQGGYLLVLLDREDETVASSNRQEPF